MKFAILGLLAAALAVSLYALSWLVPWTKEILSFVGALSLGSWVVALVYTRGNL